MALQSKTFESSLSNTYKLRLVVTEDSTSVADNNSSMSYKLYMVATTAKYYQSGVNETYKVTINGNTYTHTVKTYFNSGNTALPIGSGSNIKVPHNADGTKKLNVSASYTKASSTSYAPSENMSLSGTMNLTTTPRASSFGTVSGDTIGSTLTININRNSSSFTHSLWYSFGSKTWQGIASSAGTSVSFTPPLSLCSEIPNATSGKLTLILRTYNGSTQIGSDVYKDITIYVPGSIVPSFTSISCSEAVSDVSSKIGAYVQNRSRLNLVIIGASGSYGSTVKTYKITVNNQTINSQNGTTGVITQSGELTIEATITDSRGRTSSKSMKITVLAYYLPYFSNVKIIRDGTKAIIAGNGACVSLRNGSIEKDTFWYKIECKEKSSSVWEPIASVNTSVIAYSLNAEVNDLDEGKSYDFRLYAGDVFVWSSPYLLAVSTAFRAFDFDVINGRLGIKKVLEHEDSAIEYPDGHYIYSGDNKVLTEKGGIMRKGCLSHSANAGSGNNGYVKVATIVVTGNYQNSPIEFKIFRRGTIRPTILYLQFTNAGTNDPGISSFSYVGASCNAFIIKTSTGIFDLYIQKSEGYDNIAILLTYNYIYMSGIDIQWKNEFVSSIPSGSTQANVIS